MSRRGLRWLALIGWLGALAGASPAQAQGLHFERPYAEDMVPAPRFVRQVSPDLAGKVGRLRALRVEGSFGAPSFRFRIRASPVPAGYRWRYRVTDRAGQRQLLRRDAVGPLEEWSEELPGNGALILIEGDAPVPGTMTVAIEALSIKEVRSRPEGIVGPRNLETYEGQGEPVRTWGRAVARIRYMEEGYRRSCTGFLVAKGLMITNQHCLKTDAQARQAEIDFGLDSLDSVMTLVSGGTLEASDPTLDFAVIRLGGGTEPYAALALTEDAPVAGQKLLVIQHPEGQFKQTSADEDCTVLSLGAAGVEGAPVDLKHGCDTERGSSGAPVLDRATGRVIGLHHLGCVDVDCDQASGIVNQAVPFATILEWLRAHDRAALATELLPPEVTDPVMSPSPPLASAVAPAVLRRPVPESLSEPLWLPGTYGARFQLAEENDVLGLTRMSDNFYSQGLRMSSIWPLPADARLGKRLKLDSAELVGFELGQNIYTPSDIQLTDLSLLRRDRPYAGYAYLGLIWEGLMPSPRAWGNDGFLESATAQFHVDLAFGGTGPSAIGGPIQANFHSLLRAISQSDIPFAPQGWGTYETANAFSVDLSMHGQFDVLGFRTWLGRWSNRTGSELGGALTPRARIDVGRLFRAAELGLEARFGLMAAPKAMRGPVTLPVQLYVFGRGDARAVGYNGLIEGTLLGQLRPEVQTAPVVFDLNAGIVLRVGPVEVVVSQLWRTNELRDGVPGTPSIHNVGTIHLALLY